MPVKKPTAAKPKTFLQPKKDVPSPKAKRPAAQKKKAIISSESEEESG